MVFLHSSYLWLLLALPALWFFPRGQRDVRHVALRAAVFALLILGLARPVRIATDAESVHVFVLDASSGGKQVLGELCDSARTIGDEAQLRLVVCGASVSLDEEQRALFASTQNLSATGSASPLGAALQAASNLIPRGAQGSVTLVSDGLATDRRWANAVQALESRGLPVHTLQLDRPTGDVYPVSLAALDSLLVGHTAQISVELVGVAQSLDLRLNGPTGELASLTALICDGRMQTTLEFEPQEAGFLPLTLEVSVTDGANRITTNDSIARTFAVDDSQRVLYLGQRMVGGDSALGNLVGQGFAVEAWDGSELTAAKLANYDVTVLDDLPAEALGEVSQRAIVSAIKDGGLGLFASGGAAGFGPGGYHDQPLAEVLPVEFVQKEEKRDPSTTLVVIIDTSGSMGGNRVQLAKEVARLAIRRLLPHDKVGIVEFYGAKHWAAPIQPASNAIELERALNRMDAGGGTVILPAIEEAFYGLKNVQTRYKHVLILTDGGVESGAFEPLLRNMAEDGMNVSTVLIGPEAHSEFLVRIANWGKGRFYSVPNRFNLPEILLKQPASAKLPSYRPGSHVVQARGGAGWWGDVDMTAVPALAGYVETRSRVGAEVLLETAEGAHPVLGSWRYGLGRVTAFTSEPTGPGTEPWREWDGFGPWLARILERTASDQRVPYRYSLERDGSQMVFSAIGRGMNAKAPVVSRVGENGAFGEVLPLRERAPGHYEARFFVAADQEVRLVAETGEGSALQRARLVSSAHADVAAEDQVDPRGALDLAALANATGGSVVASGAGLASLVPSVGGGLAPVSITRLWPWFILLALLIYLIEIYYRRSGLRRGA